MVKIFKIPTIFTIVFSLTILNACNNKQEVSSGDSGVSEEENSTNLTLDKKQFESSQMEFGNVAWKKLSKQVQANGYIDVPPGNRASVSPYYGGFVKTIDLLPGEKIKKGQLLFSLENPEFIQMQQDYLEAKEQLEYLKADYERQEILAKENIASQKNFLKAKSDFKVIQSKYLGLKEKLKLMNISVSNLEKGELVSTIYMHSPITGFVTKVNAIKGMFLHPADIAVELTGTDHLHLELQVFEKDIINIKEEQKILFRIPDGGPETYEGEVHLVGKAIESTNRSVNVHGHLKNESEPHNFLPGMFVEAKIITDSALTKCLPTEAIIEVDDKNFVLVKASETDGDYKLIKKEVVPGRISEGWTEITNADEFNDKDVFLTKGAFNLITE